MSFRLSLTLVLAAALVAGCSRQEPAEPQAAAAQGSLAGKIDRSHSGNLMPAVALTHPDGETLNTGALAGQPVLLNLWATWCAPCVEEMPTLDALAGEYAGKLRVLTASQDLEGAAKVSPFFAEHNYEHLEPWLDRETRLSFELGGEGQLPTTVLYDASGQEVARVVGGFDWQSPEAKALVDEAISPAG